MFLLNPSQVSSLILDEYKIIKKRNGSQVKFTLKRGRQVLPNTLIVMGKSLLKKLLTLMKIIM